MEIEKSQLIEYTDLPQEQKDRLKAYIAGTDLSVNNGAYIRYPHIFDWGDEWKESEFDQWLFANGVDKSLGHVIIHFDW